MPLPSASRELPPLIAALCQPSFHAPQAGAAVDHIQLIQTHISYLVLAGKRVLKIKKPVRFSFLDFSTLERRRFYCHEEVRLNRRLAGDVYDGVVGIYRRDGRYQLCNQSDPAVEEVAVSMQRLPAERMLARLLESGRAQPAHVEAIIARLLPFYAAAEGGAEVAAAGAPQRIAELMLEDFEEMQRFRGETIVAADDDAIRSFCLATLEHDGALLRRRISEGRVRDGHGDLHSENICLSEHGVVIFDCIEFNAGFRQRDVAADIAFLAMDLEYRGRVDLARQLVQSFAVQSGDRELPGLVPMFACHRAYIRGKVDSLKSEEIEVAAEDRVRARASARSHFELAYRLSWSRTCCLIVVMGLSGTGKSSLARELRQRIGAVHLSSDVIRKRLAGLPPTSRAGAGDESWLYSAELSASTYRIMLEEAGATLRAGGIAIVDATFLRRDYRDQARALAGAHDCPVLLIECVASAEVVERRLSRRAEADSDASDATREVYQRQRRDYEPVAVDGCGDWLAIDSERPLAESVAQIEGVLRRTASSSPKT